MTWAPGPCCFSFVAFGPVLVPAAVPVCFVCCVCSLLDGLRGCVVSLVSVVVFVVLCILYVYVGSFQSVSWKFDF